LHFDWEYTERIEVNVVCEQIPTRKQNFRCKARVWRVPFFIPIPKGDNTMDYGMIGKREKARRYAEERNRFLFNKFELTFHGDNNNHHVTFDNGTYRCDCEFFVTHLRCAHTMAIEILFQGMIPDTVAS
jgi:hypothetical protein